MPIRRFGNADFGLGLDITPTVRRLLVANFAVWFVQIGFGLAHSSRFEEFLALDPPAVLPWRPWQLVTYMFLHSAPGQPGFLFWHIFLNMLTLAFFGGAVERHMGARRFLGYYLICGVAGGLLTLLPPFRAVTVGASGAVLGVLLAFGLLFPDAPVTILFVTLPAKLLVIAVALFNVLSAVGARGGISYSAHLGGMAAGYLMLRGVPLRGQLSRRWQAQERARRARRARQRADLRQRMDDVLDKMNRDGRDSLSQEDWRTLLDESRRLRDN